MYLPRKWLVFIRILLDSENLATLLRGINRNAMLSLVRGRLVADNRVRLPEVLGRREGVRVAPERPRPRTLLHRLESAG